MKDRNWKGLGVMAVIAGVVISLISTSGQWSGGYTIGWIMWGGWFVVNEGIAFWNDDYEGTLTAHIRQWFGTEGKAPGWMWRRMGLVFGLAILASHFFKFAF